MLKSLALKWSDLVSDENAVKRREGKNLKERAL